MYSKIALIVQGVDVKGNPVKDFLCRQYIIKEEEKYFKTVQMFTLWLQFLGSKGTGSSNLLLSKIQQSMIELYRVFITKRPKVTKDMADHLKTMLKRMKK